MKFWYVLFVRTGSEDSVKKRLADRLDPIMFEPFVPRQSTTFRRKGVIREETEICFPGYVFVQSNYSPEEFKARLFPVVYGIREAYKILSYGDSGDMIALREDEREFVSKLFGDRYVIEKSIGVTVGDAVKVTSGSLMGMEGLIRKINRHKREAVIEVSIMGDVRRLTVGLEIVQKN